MKYFNTSREEIFEILKSSENGLTNEEAKKRLKEYGYNRLEEVEEDGILKVFMSQFKDLLIIILIISSIVSYISGSHGGSVVIIIVLLLNATIGTIQHIQARKSMEGLKKLSSPKNVVIRDGEKTFLTADEIVPGDICIVEAGDVIPADARVISSYSLLVNENSLTGESEAVEKISSKLEYEDLALGDQKNMVFSGGLVSYGRGEILITSTGMNTEIGKIAKLLGETKSQKTPLQMSMDDFGKKLSFGIIGLCVIIFALYTHYGNPMMESMLLAVALAVAAIPEALTPIVTIVLSYEAKQLSKENAIIKDLKSIESLGSVSIICSDKTGTLTQNKMTVQKLYMDGEVLNTYDIDINNEGENLLLNSMVLCSDATDNIGDPTEIALIDFVKKFDFNFLNIRSENSRLYELPFDSDRKLMSTLINYKNRKILFTKGALDSLVNKITKIIDINGKVREISNEDIKEITETNYKFAEDGLRVLAFAFKEFNKDNLDYKDENDYIFVGLVSMIDPPRSESKQAVSDCIQAGIKPIMITGDHKITARSIAKTIGIFKDGDDILEGVELEKMSDDELLKIVQNISVYARVSPEHKIRIVNAWQKLGYICAMTGDGVNDAPALKKANIGVAMGITGTEVSKNAASMILADDNFSTIIKTVLSGRNIYRNIKNSIGFLLSGNMAAIIAVIYTTFLNLPLIFSPVQLLFINLLTDSLPAIAIGVESKSDDVLKEKPRDPKEGILNREFLQKMIIRGILISIAVIISFHIGLKLGGALKASTLAFATLSLARLFHTFNYRSERSIFSIGLFTNMYAVYSFVIGLILLFIVLFTNKLYPLFVITNLNMQEILILFGMSIAPTLIIQLKKIIFDK